MFKINPRFGAVDFNVIKPGKQFVYNTGKQKSVIKIQEEPTLSKENEQTGKAVYAVKVQGLPYINFVVFVKDKSNKVDAFYNVTDKQDEYIKKEPLEAFKDQ